MTFEELGALLRSEREKKNIDISDAAGQLKINAKYLRALEEGDASALPHPVYTRGFIRSYAKFLGMDPEEAREALGAAPGAASEKPAARAVPRAGAGSGKRQSRAGLMIFIILCLLAGGLYYLWSAGHLEFIKEWRDKESRQSGGLQSAESYIAAKDAEKARREAAGAALPPQEDSGAERALPLPGANPLPAAPEPAPAFASLPPAETAIQPALPAEEPAAAEAAVIAESPGPAGQHKLIITAVEECWVHSNADKTDTRQFSLRKGDTFALTFADSLELKLGNAGGVQLRYDGSDLPPPGASGQVRTLTFPPKSNS